MQNFKYNLNNIFFFSNLKKTKKTKHFLLYIYWSFILHRISKYIKMKYLLEKKIKLKCLKNLNSNYLKKYRKFIKYDLKLYKLKILNYYKKKISINKILVSYFFDFLIKYIPARYKKENLYLIIKQLKYWKSYRLNKLFIGFKYYKLLLKKKIINLKSRYNIVHKNDILKNKLNILFNALYNMNIKEVQNYYRIYNNFFIINNLNDILVLLDRKLEYIISNLYCLLNSYFYKIKDNVFINGISMLEYNYVSKNAIIIKMLNYVNMNNWKKIFNIFLIFNNKNNKSLNSIDIYKFNTLKKIYLYYLSLNFNTINTNTVLKYIKYQYNYNIYHSCVLKKTILNVLFKNKNLKKKFIKLNLYINIKNYNKSNFINFSNFIVDSINNIILLIYIYFILKKKTILFKLYKKYNNYLILIDKISIVDHIILYLKYTKINKIFFIYLNRFLNIINIRNILYYIYNLNIENVDLSLFDKKTNIIYCNNNEYYFFEEFVYNTTILKKNETNSKNLFSSLYIVKNAKKILQSFTLNSILYNYYNLDKIVYYKDLILFYNLNTKNNYFNNYSFWLHNLDLNKNIHINKINNIK